MWRDPFWSIRNTSRIFEDMDKEFEEAEDMLGRIFRTVREINPSDLVGNFPYFYGYQVSIGPDGKPHVREFGNIKPNTKGLVSPSEIRQPLVDTGIDEKGNLLTITAEMPGVTKQDVKVSLSEEQVSIHAEKGDKKYNTDIP